MRAYIIANGTSRSQFSLESLDGHGIIFGCNALYREYAPKYTIPNYLVAIDPGMIREIETSEFPLDRFIVPPHDECWEPAACNPYRPRSNAGINAMREAIKMNANMIIGLGFDFMLLDVKQSISNIYDGTQNYGMNVRARYDDNAGRARYLNWLAVNNPTIDFVLCYPKIAPMHKAVSNIHFVTYDDFIRHNFYRDINPKF